MKYVYKTIPSFPNFEVCDEAPMDNVIRTVDTHEYLKVYLDSYGYPRVYLCKKYGGNGKFYKIHRLIAETYIGPIPKDMEIDHLDTCPEHYNHNNLRICTHKENNNNPLTRKHNSEAQKIAQKTAQDFRKKIVQQIDIDTGEVLNEYFGLREAMRQTGIAQSSITRCCNGKLKTAGGFRWRFKDL